MKFDDDELRIIYCALGSVSAALTEEGNFSTAQELEAIETRVSRELNDRWEEQLRWAVPAEEEEEIAAKLRTVH